jgi:hypothetical protein
MTVYWRNRGVSPLILILGTGRTDESGYHHAPSALPTGNDRCFHSVGPRAPSGGLGENSLFPLLGFNPGTVQAKA